MPVGIWFCSHGFSYACHYIPGVSLPVLPPSISACRLIHAHSYWPLACTVSPTAYLPSLLQNAATTAFYAPAPLPALQRRLQACRLLPLNITAPYPVLPIYRLLHRRLPASLARLAAMRALRAPHGIFATAICATLLYPTPLRPHPSTASHKLQRHHVLYGK